MSNAFRTPILDQTRNIIRSLIPVAEGGVFSLRDQRSSVKALLRASRLKRAIDKSISSSDKEGVSRHIRSILDLSASVTPSISGKGMWFKRWSSLLHTNIKQFLDDRSRQSSIVHEMLPLAGAFACPLEITKSRYPGIFSTSSLEESLASFRRVIASTYFKFPKLYFETKDVRGLAFQKRRLECHTPSNWGKYEIRCDGSGREFVAYIKNRATRDRILKEYYSVFGDEFHDSLLSVLKERKKIAKSLGFKSWTDMQAAATNGGTEDDALCFIDSVYKEGQPYIHSLLGRLKKIPLDVRSPTSRAVPAQSVIPRWSTIDEAFLLTSARPAIHESKIGQLFEYNLIFDRIVSKIAQLFTVKLEPAKSSLLLHGWHPSVRILRVSDFEGNELGYIYVDLFRRMSGISGMGPHCTALNPSSKHVRIYMGLQPPYRSDVTFRKERYFTYEEITALMHEFGHAMHVLLKPDTAPMSQLPMDLRESVSILMELYSLTDDFQDYLTDGKLSGNDRDAIRRDQWFYVDIVRNLAVSEYLHSSRFDPDISDASALKRVAREVYEKHSPIPMANFINPLGGEVTNYLLDGESRIGYLQSYMRASSWLNQAEFPAATAKIVRKEVIRRGFEPYVSAALECHLRGSVGPCHPLPPLSSKRNGNTSSDTCSSSSIWEFVSPKLKIPMK